MRKKSYYKQKTKGELQGFQLQFRPTNFFSMAKLKPPQDLSTNIFLRAGDQVLNNLPDILESSILLCNRASGQSPARLYALQLLCHVIASLLLNGQGGLCFGYNLFQPLYFEGKSGELIIDRFFLAGHLCILGSDLLRLCRQF